MNNNLKYNDDGKQFLYIIFSLHLMKRKGKKKIADS